MAGSCCLFSSVYNHALLGFSLFSIKCCNLVGYDTRSLSRIKSSIANEIAAILIDCWWILKSVLSLIRICFSVVQHAVCGEMRSY